MNIKLNMNDRCRVTLTKEGAAQYNSKWSKCSENSPKKEGDTLETQLWSLMGDFGEMLQFPKFHDLPFKDNEIEML